MKGLTVALLTLFTACYATAQEQGQFDEGGTFVLKLTGPQFETLLNNREGLIATIPVDARGEISEVVIKLMPDVFARENELINSKKPGVAPVGSVVPALDPSQGSQTTQLPFRANPSNSNTTPPSSIPSFNTPGQVAQAGGQPLGGAPSGGQTRGGNTAQPWLEFGDNTDFIPVVRKKQWMQPPQRANHLTNNEFNRDLGELRNPTPRNNGQGFVSPDFNRNTTLPSRDRNLDIAQRNPVQPELNNFPRTNFNNGNGQAQPVSQPNVYDQAMQALQNENKDIKSALVNLTNQIAQSNQRQNNQLQNPMNDQSYNPQDYRRGLNDSQFERSTTDRIARNPPFPSTSPRIRDVENTETNDQSSTPDGTELAPSPSKELVGKNHDLAKANTFLLFMLLCSIGLNIYLGLIARSFYMRYAELADELRETFTATM